MTRIKSLFIELIAKQKEIHKRNRTDNLFNYPRRLIDWAANENTFAQFCVTRLTYVVHTLTHNLNYMKSYISRILTKRK